ncbi:MAG: hypothetical protein U9O94_05930 [Nanoarchaeota archaeon]|nr:hypothetical protein [Nanoarchaeota archaeon]
MFLTHSNMNYSTQLQLIENIPHPQYVNMITDGGMVVAKGLRLLPDIIFRNTLNKNPYTAEQIKKLTSNPEIKIGFILATGGSVWSGHKSTVKLSDAYPVHKVMLLGTTHIYAGKIANSLGKFDYITTNCSSCTSGHSSWQIAKMLIDTKTLDAVVVVALDNATAEENLHVFAKTGLCKKASEEGNPDIVKFHLGQGCHIGIFESERSINISKNTPLAEIEKIAVTCEHSSNPIGMLPSGEGYHDVITDVMKGAYDFIKPHGTYTDTNFPEEEIIKQIFGDIITHTYKLRIGHTLGASTALETALAIEEHTGRFISLGAGMGNTFSAASVRIIK